MLNHLQKTRLAFIAALVLLVTPAMAEVKFDTTFEAFGLEEDASPQTAKQTTEGITLNVDAGDYSLHDATHGKSLGIQGNKTGQINADETLTLRFDKPVQILEVNLGGLDEDDAGKPESVVIEVVSLELKWTVTSDSVTPQTAGVSMGDKNKLTIAPGVLTLLPESELTLQAGTAQSSFNLRSLDVEAVDNGEPM